MLCWARAAAFSHLIPPAFPWFTSAPQPQQLDYLQEQMRAGKLEPGWPIYREADGLYIYLEGELSLGLILAVPGGRGVSGLILAFMCCYSKRAWLAHVP